MARAGQQQLYWAVSFTKRAPAVKARPPPPPAGVLGGGILKADDYADFLAGEYLSGYLPSGGAAVKVAVAGNSGAADRLESALAAATAELGGCSGCLGRVDQGAYGRPDFFAVARAVDWDGLAAERPGRVPPGGGSRACGDGSQWPKSPDITTSTPRSCIGASAGFWNGGC